MLTVDSVHCSDYWKTWGECTVHYIPSVSCLSMLSFKNDNTNYFPHLTIFCCQKQCDPKSKCPSRPPYGMSLPPSRGRVGERRSVLSQMSIPFCGCKSSCCTDFTGLRNYSAYCSSFTFLHLNSICSRHGP